MWSSCEVCPSHTTVAFLDSLWSPSSEIRQALPFTTRGGGWMMLNICEVEIGNWKQCRCQNSLGLTRSLCIVVATGDCDGEALPIFGVWVARLRCSWYISVISRGGAVCSALISVTSQYLCAAVVQNAWTILSRLQAVAVEVPQQTNNFDCGIYVGTSVIWSLWSVHWWMCKW